MTLSKDQIAAFIAAQAAVAAEQAAVDANMPSATPPAVSDRARELLRKGGVERVIDSGDCPNCATALFEHRMAVAAHNRRMDALAAAKEAAGYDKAAKPLLARLMELAPKRVTRKDLSDAESQELADLATMLAINLIVPKAE